MMELTEEQKREGERQFDAYCCKILNLKARTCHAKLAKKAEKEQSLDDLSAVEIEALAIRDKYPSCYTCFTVPGFDFHISIEDERIAEACSHLDTAKRNIVLLYFFLDMRDWEIAELLHVVRRTVCYRRQAALKVLRLLLEETNE